MSLKTGKRVLELVTLCIYRLRENQILELFITTLKRQLKVILMTRKLRIFTMRLNLSMMNS